MLTATPPAVPHHHGQGVEHLRSSLRVPSALAVAVADIEWDRSGGLGDHRHSEAAQELLVTRPIGSDGATLQGVEPPPPPPARPAVPART